MIAVAGFTAVLLTPETASPSSFMPQTYFPGPELYSPCTDNVPLRGREELKFDWHPLTPAFLRRYVFKLYRGYSTTDDSKIMETELLPSSYSFAIPATEFVPGEVYSWELSAVFIDGMKTEKSFCSFKVGE